MCHFGLLQTSVWQRAPTRPASHVNCARCDSRQEYALAQKQRSVLRKQGVPEDQIPRVDKNKGRIRFNPNCPKCARRLGQFRAYKIRKKAKSSIF